VHWCTVDDEPVNGVIKLNGRQRAAQSEFSEARAKSDATVDDRTPKGDPAMRNTLIALSAAAALGALGLATTPASAAPVAPAHLPALAGTPVETVHYAPPHVRRHIRRELHHHFWAPGPWAFRGVPFGNCFPVRHGYFCYY
jgi:hypothetical protein